MNRIKRKGKKIQLFIKFLISEGIYYNYLKNTRFNKINLKFICPGTFILNTFSWASSEEGYCMWDDINHKWLNYLSKF